MAPEHCGQAQADTDLTSLWLLDQPCFLCIRQLKPFSHLRAQESTSNQFISSLIIRCCLLLDSHSDHSNSADINTPNLQDFHPIYFCFWWGPAPSHLCSKSQHIHPAPAFTGMDRRNSFTVIGSSSGLELANILTGWPWASSAVFTQVSSSLKAEGLANPVTK